MPAHSAPVETITVAGAGVLGLWQALTLARAGHKVRLLEASATFGSHAASRWGGVMLAPDCETETAPSIVSQEGHRGLDLWRAAYPGVIKAGTLVVALPRDRAELQRFAGLTHHHQWIDGDRLAELEPSLAGRFDQGLYFLDEAHMAAEKALAFLLAEVNRMGVEVLFGTPWDGALPSAGRVIDCRGYDARHDLSDLRGVRGERVRVHAPGVDLSRPVRLLHPRHPMYVVPQGDDAFVIGATIIERDDNGPATVRSVLELLGSAYALTPTFGEASILDMGAGVRPAFPDNIPLIRSENNGRLLRVNGAHRHGFLLAPVLAESVAKFLASGLAMGRSSLPFLEAGA